MNPAQATIVFLDAATYGDISLRLFTDVWACTLYPVTRPAETVSRIAGHDIAVTNKVVFDGPILNHAAARNLRLIAVAATGTDIIDKETAVKRRIQVSNVPDYATQSVAQFTMALILGLATRLEKYSAAVRSGEWQNSPVFSVLSFSQQELAGKKLGIIGYGSIGRAVAQMARGFGMEILIGARPGHTNSPPDRIALDRLFLDADFISLHCPLTPETTNLINSRSLSLMKPTGFLINTARGALIDEPALIEALRQRRIAGAALDVITQEPPAANHPVIEAARGLDNLIVTPHTAWSAREARERLLIEVKENIVAFLQGRDRNRIA